MGKCFSSCIAVMVSGTTGQTNEFGSVFLKTYYCLIKKICFKQFRLKSIASSHKLNPPALPESQSFLEVFVLHFEMS